MHLIHSSRIFFQNLENFPNSQVDFQTFCTLEHCVKSVRIRSFSGPYFPAFGLSTERYSVSLHIQSECGKMPTRKTPKTDTFHAVEMAPIFDRNKNKGRSCI